MNETTAGQIITKGDLITLTLDSWGRLGSVDGFELARDGRHVLDGVAQHEGVSDDEHVVRVGECRRRSIDVTPAEAIRRDGKSELFGFVGALAVGQERELRLQVDVSHPERFLGVHVDE